MINRDSWGISIQLLEVNSWILLRLTIESIAKDVFIIKNEG